MTALLIDGNAYAGGMAKDLAARAAALRARGIVPTLVALAVDEKPESQVYTKKQAEQCQAVGIDYRLLDVPSSLGEAGLLARLEEINNDPSVHGIIVQLPLPEGYDRRRIQAAIHPDKDAEGVNPTNLGLLLSDQPCRVPCTALAAFKLAQSTGVSFKGAQAVVLGRSEIVGKPVGLLAMREHATLTICHSRTRDLPAVVRQADILFVAVGRAEMVKADWIRPGAVVVDVGINRVNALDKDGKPLLNDKGKPKKKTVGDVDFAAAKEVAGYLTPVPGGVGPVTVMTLLNNVLEGAGG